MLTAQLASAAGGRWSLIVLYGGAAGLAVLTVLEVGLQVIGHDDLWWNLAAGRHIARNSEIPTVDVFTHTFAGKPWLNFEWLSNLIFFEVYDHLGENWIAYLRIGLIFLIFGITFALCRMRSGSWLISLLVVAFGAWVCRPFLDARPQLFTFLYSILLLLILHLFRRRGRNLLFLIPVILLVWTQQHGGYFFGLLLLVGNVLAESGKKLLGLPTDPLSWRQIRTLAAVTLVAAAAIAINPWTLEAYADPLRMSKLVTGPNVFLEVTGEWLRPRFLGAEGLTPFQFWPFLFLVGQVTLPIALARWRSFDFNDTGLAVVLAFAFALQHRRFIPLFAILTLPLLSYGLRFWVDWWLHGRREPGVWKPGSALPEGARTRLRRTATLVALGCWLLLAALLPSRLSALNARYARETLFRTSIHYEYYPERAVRFLRDIEIPGRMFNFYNWGGFLEFALPEQKTFIDGRAQMVFDEAFHQRYLTARWGYRDWEGVMDEYGVTWALIHTDTNAALFRAMDRDPDWTQVFGHDSSAVFLKECPENRELLAAYRRRELPLPETALTYLIYGRNASRSGDTEQALRDLTRGYELAPGDEEIRSRYILALAAAGRLDAAREQADRALAELPDSVPLQLARARLEEAADRDEEAFRIVRGLFERAPKADEVIDTMLELDAEEGRRVIERAYDRDPRKPWASYAMGRLAEATGDLERARRFYYTEGRQADEAGDRARVLRCKQALDRTDDRPESP